MRNIAITFGIICLCSLVLFEMAKVAYIKNTLPVEILVGFFACLFLVIGILVARRPHSRESKQEPIAVAEPVTPIIPEPAIVATASQPDQDKIEALGISKREYEVLCLVALGLSNMEIAQKLFVSESTIKTHISNLLLKLNAKRRTEAVVIAKELKII